MKPKSNRKPGPLDNCQTPAYALEPLIPYLKAAKFRTIWEPARGEGYLVKAISRAGFSVIATDISDGEYYDFFDYDLTFDGKGYDAIITNPPYSMKYEWTWRCYHLHKPFALLMPVEMLGTVKGGDMFADYGIRVMLLRPRVNFKMPNKGWEGGGAQFPVAWFTHGLHLPSRLMFERIKRR